MHEADVRTWLVHQIAQFLDIAEAEVRPDREFTELGLDSVDAVVIGGELEERFDVEIEAAMLLRSNTIDALMEDLRQAGLLTG